MEFTGSESVSVAAWGSPQPYMIMTGTEARTKNRAFMDTSSLNISASIIQPQAKMPTAGAAHTCNKSF